MGICVGRGVKMFKWVFRMYGGGMRFSSGMVWGVGLMGKFVMGGVSGVMVGMAGGD